MVGNGATISCLLSKRANPEPGVRAWGKSGADWHQRLAPVAVRTECLPDGQSDDGWNDWIILPCHLIDQSSI